MTKALKYVVLLASLAAVGFMTPRFGVSSKPAADHSGRDPHATGSHALSIHAAGSHAQNIHATNSRSVAGGMPQLDFTKVQPLKLDHLPKGRDGRSVAARVDGREISEREFLQELELAVSGEKRNSPGVPEDALRTALAGPVLDRLIRTELLAGFAEKQKLHVSEHEIDLEIQASDAKLSPGRKTGDTAIGKGQTKEEMRSGIRKRLLSGKAEQQIGADAAPASPEELSRFLALSHASTTNTPEVRASHIAIRAPQGESDAKTTEARERAERILSEIQSGLRFDEAARRYSQDQFTRKTGGDLGYFTRGKMYPEFDAVAFSLQPGQVSGVVRTPAGFHIIKVTGRNSTNAQELYKAASRKRVIEDWLKAAIPNAKIEKFL